MGVVGVSTMWTEKLRSWEEVAVGGGDAEWGWGETNTLG